MVRVKTTPVDAGLGRVYTRYPAGPLGGGVSTVGPQARSSPSSENSVSTDDVMEALPPKRSRTESQESMLSKSDESVVLSNVLRLLRHTTAAVDSGHASDYVADEDEETPHDGGDQEDTMEALPGKRGRTKSTDSDADGSRRIRNPTPSFCRPKSEAIETGICRVQGCPNPHNTPRHCICEHHLRVSMSDGRVCWRYCQRGAHWVRPDSLADIRITCKSCREGKKESNARCRANR